MVVLSVAIITRNGKALVARQFVPIERLRLEGLLTAFPKLLDNADSSSSSVKSSTTTSRQHTYIDTESVRYVYQPMESFYLLLVTNKTSNLVQDLASLQLISKIIPDVCGGGVLSESAIQTKQFDLVFAFDEAFTAGGHAEHVTLSQIRTNMEMESHEEKLHNMILQSKRDAAKSEMKRQQQRIKGEQRERVRNERAGGGSSSFGNTNNSSSSSSAYSSPYVPAPAPVSTPTPASAPAVKKTSGMKLGGAKKGKNFMDAMVEEDDLSELPPVAMEATMSSSSGPQSSTTAASVVPPTEAFDEPIVVSMEEKMNVSLNRDGGVEGLDVKGTLYVGANDPASALVRLALDTSNSSDINFQCHPKVDKKLFESQSILGLKDSKKPFPESRVGVLRWSVKSTEEDMLPLSLTCWPEDEGNGKFTVNLEYTMERQMSLQNVNISVPVGTADTPAVISIDGDFRHHPSSGALQWHLDSIDESNGTGTLEFSIRASDVEDFFPIQLSFFTKSTYADISVKSVNAIANSDNVDFAFNKVLTTDTYQIE